MNITSSAAPATRQTYAQLMQAREAASQAAATRKAKIAEETGKTLSSASFSGPEHQKAQAKAKLQQIIEWLKIVKKLYANDPKGMAKALAQVFKDLKAAVKAYRDAGGKEMSLSGAATAPPPVAAGQENKEAAEAPDAPDAVEGAVEGAEPTPSGEETGADADDASTDPEKTAAAGGASIYEAVAREVRKSVGEDGLDFLKFVRGLTQDLTDLLATARGQATIRKKDKATDKAFEEADKALKSLNEEMTGMERDIRQAAPEAGMRLSLAA
ncbi:MAG: hypothetical protein GC145_09025 [Caulobacter sp.]|nr:hypothetical protein [Caulobacter sp.]